MITWEVKAGGSGVEASLSYVSHWLKANKQNHYRLGHSLVYKVRRESLTETRVDP